MKKLEEGLKVLETLKDKSPEMMKMYNDIKKLSEDMYNPDNYPKNPDGTRKYGDDPPVPELEDKTITAEVIANNEVEKASYDEGICKVSIVGVGMKSHTGVAAKAFSTMAQENINILMISTSEIKVSMVIEEKYAELAVRALHDIYELDK